jgi:SAM-dependent methyltransferase
MTNIEFVYSGHENLLAMQFAKKYNNFLKSELIRYSVGKKKILDFGAGIGVYAKTFHDLGLEPICVEVDKVQSDQLEKNGYFVISTIKDVPQKSIEYVYTLNVLEHIENDIEEIKNIYDSLEYGGIFFVYVPAVPWIYSSMDSLVGHYRRYTKDELILKLESVGFSIKRSEYIDFLGVWVTLLYKLLDRSGGKVSPTSIKFYDRFIFPISRLFDFFLKQIIGKNILIICEKV